jgi:hypothetical protein
MCTACLTSARCDSAPRRAEICTSARQKNLRPDAIQAIARQGWAGRRISQDSASGILIVELDTLEGTSALTMIAPAPFNQGARPARHHIRRRQRRIPKKARCRRSPISRYTNASS